MGQCMLLLCVQGLQHVFNPRYLPELKEEMGLCSRSVFGVEPSQMSFLFFLMYATAAGGLLPLLESTSGSAQELKIKVCMSCCSPEYIFNDYGVLESETKYNLDSRPFLFFCPLCTIYCHTWSCCSVAMKSKASY